MQVGVSDIHRSVEPHRQPRGTAEQRVLGRPAVPAAVRRRRTALLRITGDHRGPVALDPAKRSVIEPRVHLATMTERGRPRDRVRGDDRQRRAELRGLEHGRGAGRARVCRRRGARSRQRRRLGGVGQQVAGTTRGLRLTALAVGTVADLVQLARRKTGDVGIGKRDRPVGLAGAERQRPSPAALRPVDRRARAVGPIAAVQPGVEESGPRKAGDARERRPGQICAR